MSRRLQSTPHDYERIASLSLFIFHRTPYRSEFAPISSFDIQTFSFSSTPDFHLRLFPSTTTRLQVSGRLRPRHPDDLASAFPIPALKQSTYSGKRLRSREPFRSLAKCDFRTTRQVRVARLQKDSCPYQKLRPRGLGGRFAQLSPEGEVGDSGRGTILVPRRAFQGEHSASIGTAGTRLARNLAKEVEPGSLCQAALLSYRW
jgi:hypothetical protein